MSTVSHNDLAANWILPLTPPELEVLDELDVFADNDQVGLLLYEPKPTFADYLEFQADRFRSQEEPEALFLAGLLQAAADTSTPGPAFARHRSATSPASRCTHIAAPPPVQPVTNW